MPETISEDLTFDVNYKKSKQAKSVRLKINREGNVVVTYPAWLNKKKALDFFKENIAWVQESVHKIKSRKTEFKTGHKLYYQGQKISLGILYDTTKRPRIYLNQDKLVITVNRLPDETQQTELVKKLVIRWYKQQATTMILERLQHFNEIYQFPHGDVRIKDQKTRWGSCSSKKNLNFNWRLIKAPPSVLDYVVVHELCHLKELNHSNRFWSLVQQTIPDCYTQKIWLKQHYEDLISF